MILLSQNLSCQNVGYFSRFVNELSAAVILFFSIFMINGIQKPVDQPILGTIMEDKAAAQAGLQVGDRILAINGKRLPHGMIW